MILAIGGSASVGKTTLAATLAARLDVHEIVHVDDLVPAVERDEGPSFLAAAGVWRRPPDWLRDQLVAWTERLHPHIDRAIRPLVHAIVEGEGIDHRLACRWPPDEVRVVYVIETDADALHRTFASRASADRYLALSDSERHAVVEMNRRYGLWLRAAAETNGQPWVPSQPWSTLADRVLAAVGLAVNRRAGDG